MHQYSKLILKQRRLLGVITHCSRYRPDLLVLLESQNNTLHEKLDEEKKKLISANLNPIDFHPLPCYAPDNIYEHYEFYENQLKEFYVKEFTGTCI